MRDVFVSYAHSEQDQPVAREMVQRLEKFTHPIHNKPVDCWLDEQDIEYSTPWWERIKTGIETATHMLVILSNDYLASEVCNEELRHALSLSKPIIVVCTEFPTPEYQTLLANRSWQRNLPELAETHRKFLLAINLIQVNKIGLETAAQEAFHSLTLNTFYTDGLTVWMNRLRDWDQRQRTNRSLLSGADIDAAEQWRDIAASEQRPLPSELLRFIQLSREVQRRSRRILQIASVIALIIISGLGVLTFNQYLFAEDRRIAADRNEATAISAASTSAYNADLARANAATAVYQAGIAKSRYLANVASTLITTDPELAALLAVEAVTTQPYTADAQRVLTSLSPYQPREIGAGDFALLSPDRRYLSQLLYGDVYLSELTDTSDSKNPISAPLEDIRMFSWSPDSTKIAYSFVDRMYIADVDTLMNVIEIPFKGGDYNPKWLVWSPDGTKIALAPYANNNVEASFDVIGGSSNAAGIIVISSDDGFKTITPIQFPLEQQFVTQLAWSHDGKYLLVDVANLRGFEPSIVYDVDKRETLSWNTPTGELPDGMHSKWSPTTNLLWIDNAIYDTDSREKRFALDPNGAAFTVANWSPDGTKIANKHKNNAIAVWDVATGNQITTLGVNLSDVFAWAMDSNRIASLGNDQTLRVWDMAQAAEIGTFPLKSDGVFVAWTMNDEQVIALTDKGILQRFRLWSSTDDLVAAIKSCCITRPLTIDERIHYQIDLPTMQADQTLPVGKFVAGEVTSGMLHTFSVMLPKTGPFQLISLGNVAVNLFDANQHLVPREKWNTSLTNGSYLLTVEPATPLRESATSERQFYGLLIASSLDNRDDTRIVLDIPIVAATLNIMTSDDLSRYLTVAEGEALYIYVYAGSLIDMTVTSPSGVVTLCGSYADVHEIMLPKLGWVVKINGKEAGQYKINVDSDGTIRDFGRKYILLVSKQLYFPLDVMAGSCALIQPNDHLANTIIP